MKEYVVLFERSESGYNATVPDLPGCEATGNSLKETGDLIIEAIQFHLDALRAQGVSIPEPTTLAGTFMLE